MVPDVGSYVKGGEWLLGHYCLIANFLKAMFQNVPIPTVQLVMQSQE